MPLIFHSKAIGYDAPFKKSEKYTHMLGGLFVFISNKVDASSLSVPATYSVSQPSYVPSTQNVSAYDFSGSDYNKDQPYDVCGTNPVVEKYFLTYGRGNLISYETMNGIFENPKQLVDLEDTVNKILKDLQGPLEQMPEQVKGMIQGGIGSSVKQYASNWIGYFNGGTEYKFSTFLRQNEHRLLFPADFFSKYTDFLLKHITKEITGYGDQYGIPDELFERLGLLNEFDKVFTVCEEYNWEVPVDEVLSVINESILDSYRHLSTMLEKAQIKRRTLYECKDEMWTKRAKIYKHFISRANKSIYDIVNKISDIQNGISPESPRGNIQSESIYDVTSPSNKAGQSEDIDMNHLEGVIRELSDARVNNAGSEYVEKVGNIDGITPLGPPIEGYRLGGDYRTGEDYYGFKYLVGSKTYFLKSIDFSSLYSSNDNNILFETLDSPYIADTYRVVYNHAALGNKQAHDRFWVVSEFLDISLESINWGDMNIVRKLASDVLEGLDYLQSQGIVHNDLHLNNVRGEQVQVNGKTEYRFKIVDFGYSYSLTGAKSLAETPEIKEWCRDLTSKTGEDLRTFFGSQVLQYFAKPAESEKPGFDSFTSECMQESNKKKPNIKKLLKHSFITGKPPTKTGNLPTKGS